jgi:FkbM family methyltransferase
LVYEASAQSLEGRGVLPTAGQFCERRTLRRHRLMKVWMSLAPTAAQLFERLPRTLRRHRLMKAWMALTGEDPLQLVRIRAQFFGYADMRDGFLRLIVIDGDFEREFFAIADKCLEKGGVFLDVGANFGLLSCGLAGRLGGKVQFHLFEPNRVLVEWIKRSTALYPAVYFKINCVAVSDRLGFISFVVNESQTGASHITLEGGEQIRSTTIDDYLDRENMAVGRIQSGKTCPGMASRCGRSEANRCRR